MEHRTLGRTDLTVSSLGVGCVTFGREIDAATSYAVMDHALERGINLFDTAAGYAAGASERVVGDWITDRGARDRIVLATKVASPLPRDRVIESAEESLQRLKTDRIDLFQVHNWDDQTPLDDTLGAFATLVDQGKVRYCGCSNYTTWQLAKTLLSANDGGVRMESIQPPYNLVQREIEADTLPLCVDQEIGVLAYSPLGAGFLTGKYRQNTEVPKGTRFDVMPGHQPIYFTDHGWRVAEKLRSKAGQLGRPMIDLALNWVIHQPGVTSVLVGARSPSHIDQAFDAEASRISEDVREQLGSSELEI